MEVKIILITLESFYLVLGSGSRCDIWSLDDRILAHLKVNILA